MNAAATQECIKCISLHNNVSKDACGFDYPQIRAQRTQDHEKVMIDAPARLPAARRAAQQARPTMLAAGWLDPCTRRPDTAHQLGA